MNELELKIEKLLKDQILITESEAQGLAALICNLPEIKSSCDVKVEPKTAKDIIKILDKAVEEIVGLITD